MPRTSRKVDVVVEYIPDVSGLKKAISTIQEIKIDIGGDALRKDFSSIQQSIRDINKAISHNADSSSLVKMFEDLNKEVISTQRSVENFKSELDSVYSSKGNQQMISDLNRYKKQLEQVEKQITNWDENFSNKVFKQMRSDLKIPGIDEARKKIKELEGDIGNLTNTQKIYLSELENYVNRWDARQKTTSRGDLEFQARDLRDNISRISSIVETPEMNVQGTKEYAEQIRVLNSLQQLARQSTEGLTEAQKRQAIAAEQAAKEQQELNKAARQEASRITDVFAGSFLGMSASNLLDGALSSAVNFFKEYDNILTRTMMVTTMNRDEVNALTDSYNDLANQLSSTTKDVAAAQLVFYQQGLNTQEALAMTEASITISKTGGIEAEEAADRLTAAIRGYQLAASDAMDIADKMSALDAAAASSVDELTVAMQKSASQARMAGLDLDYYMAYLSTMQEVTREARKEFWRASSIKNILQKPLFIV